MSASATQSSPAQKVFWQRWRWKVLSVLAFFVAALPIIWWVRYNPAPVIVQQPQQVAAGVDPVTVAKVLDEAMRPVREQVATLRAQVEEMGQRPSVPATAAPGSTAVTPPVVVQPAQPSPLPPGSSPPSITSGEGSTIVVVGNGSTVTLSPLMRSSTEPPVSVADNRFEVPPPAATAAVSTPAPTAAPQLRQRQPTRVAVNRPRAVPPPAQSGMGVYGNRTGWASLAQLNINRHP